MSFYLDVQYTDEGEPNELLGEQCRIESLAGVAEFIQAIEAPVASITITPDYTA